MLEINKEKRYLIKDGRFFPYLADTAWTLLQRLMREEICFYLDKRKKQGFNAIQVSAISELDGAKKENREGNCPFFNGNPEKPNPEFFSLVAFLADECEKRDIALVLLPTWGDKFNKKWGTGPEIFTPSNAAVYGKYIANVIGKRDNIIWMLGGDRPIETPIHRRIIDEMARGIREGEAVYHLITYHPSGEASSTDFLADAPYMDFHSLQSSHSFGGYKSADMVISSIKKTSAPVLDAECFYEDFPIGFNTDWGYRFTPKDIRKRIYSNMIAGALGHTYGHQSVWCFNDEPDDEYLYSWKQALDRPAANQMRFINRFIENADITDMQTSDITVNVPSMADEKHLIFYTENNCPTFLDFKESHKTISVKWFNPENGVFTEPYTECGSHITLYNPFSEDGACIVSYI